MHSTINNNACYLANTFSATGDLDLASCLADSPLLPSPLLGDWLLPPATLSRRAFTRPVNMLTRSVSSDVTWHAVASWCIRWRTVKASEIRDNPLLYTTKIRSSLLQRKKNN